MQRILIVDDVSDSIKLLELCLRNESDYELYSATSGHEALRLAREIHPDTILMDILMPDMDGISAFRRLRKDPVTSQVPVILITSMADDEDIVRGLDAGADDYIVKPYNPRIVAARVRNAVQRYILVKQNRTLVAELANKARKDPLTDLLNRRTFFEVFHHDLKRAARERQSCSCVMLDIDRFKAINDEQGHLAGDQALVLIADVLRAVARDSDAIGRYGGEEFCVLLPGTSLSGASVWANRCRAAIEEIEFVRGDAPIRLSASFGVASAAEGEVDVPALIGRADKALLDAKSRGRNRVVCAAIPSVARDLASA